jgi:UPF0755 protein
LTTKFALRTAGTLLVAVLLGGASIAHYVLSPLEAARTNREFSIEQGATLRAVSHHLREAGILPDAWRFELLARLLRKERSVKAGNYVVGAGWTPLRLLDAITGSGYQLDRILIPEGWTFQQLRAALEAHPALRNETRGRSDREILRLLKVDHEHPEGLFFPDTYYFARGASDLSILVRSYRRMQRMLDAQWMARAPELPLQTAYQALILASIVEKETGLDRDRGLVAGVLVNRLRLGMRLQVDPTVIYGLGEDYDGTLRRRDLDMDTAYNTYTRLGLPPTPIALPGLASLMAAVKPASTSALYFVARGDGSSHFSESLAEHNRAVMKYQRGQGVQR